jgi:hypothetical protein
LHPPIEAPWRPQPEIHPLYSLRDIIICHAQCHREDELCQATEFLDHLMVSFI